MTQPQTQKNVGFVLDMNAVTEPRFHDIPVAVDNSGKPSQVKRYILTATEPTEMPMDHARMFLRDKSFIVTDEAGSVLRPLANMESIAHVSIPDGFVLAEYEELSKDALITRAKVLPGSGHIHPVKTKVADIIAFIKNSQPKKPEVKKVDRVSEVAVSELDKMFDGE